MHSFYRPVEDLLDGLVFYIPFSPGKESLTTSQRQRFLRLSYLSSSVTLFCCTCLDAAGKKKKIRHFSRLLKSCWEGEIIAFPPKFLDYDVLVSFFFNVDECTY